MPTEDKAEDSGDNQSPRQGECNFAQLDSLRRNHFSVKIKDLAWRKRQDCKSNMVLVPDAVL